MSDRTDTCASCRFYEPDRRSQAGGVCRRRSPIVYPFERQYHPVEYQTVWPPIMGDDWCGEYEMKRG